MLILGINSYLHDSSAALFSDGRLVAAVEEERLSRLKKDTRFPAMSIRWLLEHAGATPSDLDAVAFGWNRPGATPLHTLRSTLTGAIAPTPHYIGHSLLTLLDERRDKDRRRQIGRAITLPARTPVMHVDHHLSHALSAYALSGFEESIVLVADGRGASQATSIYHATGESLRLLKVFKYPNSLGAFYEAFTDLLGFERGSDEWKVMGLAAYGEPTEDLSDILQVTPDGYRVNARILTGKRFNDLRPMIRRFGPRRDPERLITDADRNLAASAQRALEEAVFAMVRWAVRETGSRRICLAGGVAMNSKANGRLLASGIVDEVFVQPAATDDGTAIGAAVEAHVQLGGEMPRYRLDDAYLGPAYSDEEISETLALYKLPATRVVDVPATVAAMLADGAIVGWFQGRMEFGPRALGSRSILADPRRPDMKDRVNECVKFREGWRPFAPSCLEEVAGEYFAGCRVAPYMTLTFDVLPGREHDIPAVTHADGTARVQTVSRASNTRYWEMIRAFGDITGVPVVMNTSFNLRGEPIVCSPKDAIRTFYSSGLDFLVMGDHVVAKDPAWNPERSRTAVAVG